MSITRSLVLVLSFASAANAGSPVRHGEWTRLPAEVRAIAHLDMKALGATEVYRSFAAEPGRFGTGSRGFTAFVESTGFDFREDLDTLTLGAGGHDDDPDAPFYVIVRGRFEREKVERWISAEGATTTQLDGLRTYSLAADVNDGPPPTAAFLDEQTLLIASSADFPKLVDAARGRGETAGSGSLATLLAQAEGQLRIAIEVPRDERKAAHSLQEGGSATGSPSPGGIGAILDRLQEPAAGPFADLQSIVFSLDAGRGVALALRADVRSAEAGRVLHDQLAGYVMLGRMASAQRPELAGVLERLELEQAGSSVRLSVELTLDELQSAIDSSTRLGSVPAGG